MFDNNQFDLTEESTQHHQANLTRLVAIQDELKTLVQARDRILRDLAGLKSTLEAHWQVGSVIRGRAIRILQRLADDSGHQKTQDQLLTLDDEALIRELDASRQELEQAVGLTERRLKIAQFETDSLVELLGELEDQVAEIAADLDLREDGLLNESN